MINLRYHIVSITAVFLALAIGLALGSTLIQRGLVDNLEGRLDEQSERLDRTDGENADLRDEIEAQAALDEQLRVEGPALFVGHLDDVPVLVLSVQGTEDDTVAEARSSLRAAGAFVSGTLAFTARWDDLTADEVSELSALFDRQLSNEDVTRNLVLRRLADELLAASVSPEPETPVDPVAPVQDGTADTLPPDTLPPDGESAPESDPSTGTTAPAVPTDPAQPEGEVVAPDVTPEVPVVEPPPVPSTDLIGSLIALGYLEFFPESAAGPLPRFGTRFVFVSDDAAVLDPSVVAAPVIDAFARAAGSAPAPLLVAAPLGPPIESEDDGDEDVPGPTVDAVVALVRSQERLRARVSTVDNLESFEGQGAVVLGVAALATGPVGHYGVGEGATALLPPAAS